MQDDEMDSSSLKELGIALLDVSKELKDIPVFRVLTQNALAEELSKISSDHLVSRVSVNVLAGRKPISKEPVGRLLDVLIECLRQGRAPQYDPEVYGVFEHPNLTSREDAITQISVADIEMVLRRIQGSFPARYVAALQRYWENADALDNTATYPHLSRKAALALLQNIVFMRELVVLVDQQGLSLKEGTAISRLIQPGLTSTCYGVLKPMMASMLINLRCLSCQPMVWYTNNLSQKVKARWFSILRIAVLKDLLQRPNCDG